MLQKQGFFSTLFLYRTQVKSIKWRHEEEYRICIEPFGRFNYDYRAVKAIYFGMRMPKSKIDLVKKQQ